MITGHCECNAIQFEVDDAINDFSHCHCSQCRRLHGAAFATFAGVRRNKLRFMSGEANMKSYASSATHQRFFCSICGSAVMTTLDSEPEDAYLSMSMIDGDPELPAGYHIYVASKAPWHEITDALPQFPEYPPE